MSGTEPLRHVLQIAGLLLLGGCSSLGGLTAAGGRPDAATAGALSRAVFALDVPLSVEPVPPGPRLVISVPGAPGMEAVLVRSDAEPLMRALPPPPEGRTYYAFSLEPDDRAAVLALQQRLAGSAGAAATVTVVPSLCLAAGADPAKEQISILPVLDGRALPPLLSRETLASLAARTKMPLPPCQGHSG